VNTDILNSERNRPASRANASPTASGPAADAARQQLAHAITQAMSPRAVGDQVVLAIREQRFYILTHPDRIRFVEQRLEALIAAAIARANRPLPVRGRGKLIVRSIAAKQRPRQRPVKAPPKPLAHAGVRSRATRSMRSTS